MKKENHAPDQNLVDVTCNLPLGWSQDQYEGEFYLSPCNVDAWQLIQQWPWAFSVLWLYGPSGAGKSHLAHHWQHLHQAKWLEATGPWTIEKGMCYVWDHDIDPEIPESTWLELFKDLQHASCLWIAPLAPHQWSCHLPDLRSRLYATVSVAITSPDDVLWRFLLKKSLQHLGWVVPPRVLQFLFYRLPRSFASIQSITKWIECHPKTPFTPQNLNALLAWITESADLSSKF